MNRLASAAVRALRKEAASDSFKEKSVWLVNAFSRTDADPSAANPEALVYVDQAKAGRYDFEIFGGVEHNVLVPAHGAPTNQYGGFVSPSYVDDMTDEPNTAWVKSRTGD